MSNDAASVPQLMRAVLLTGHGGLDRLEFRRDVAVPSVRAGEVLVRNHASAVNNTDFNTRVGWYGASVNAGFSEEIALHGLPQNPTEPSSWNRESLTFPRIQGAAVVGVIVRVGANVPRTRIGARVVVDPVIRDMQHKRWARAIAYLGSERDGGFAEYVAVPSENALEAPIRATFAELACLPCAYQTAEEMQLRARLTSDDRVLVTGASGGVGLANVQLAKLRGARVVAIAAREKVAGVLGHGADAVVARDTPTFSADLARAVGPRGADVVLDVVGGAMTDTLWQLLDRGGRYVTAGAIGGPQAVVDLRALIYKDVEMYGVTFPEAEAMSNLLTYVGRGALKVAVDQSYPLEDLAAAQTAFAKRHHVGKIVIHIVDGS
jgi:NADPH:quinone reductase-like Zn-dependent oxidoreductase